MMMHISTVQYAAFAALFLYAGCTVPPPEPMMASDPNDEYEVVLGQEFQRAVVSLCITREQAEKVLKTQRERGPEAALRAFEEERCFTALVFQLRPLALVSAEKLGSRTVSIVEVSIPVGQRRHVLYMITPSRVVSGTRA